MELRSASASTSRQRKEVRAVRQEDFRYYDGVLAGVERELKNLRRNAVGDGYDWLLEDLGPAIKAVEHTRKEIKDDDPYTDE